MTEQEPPTSRQAIVNKALDLVRKEFFSMLTEGESTKSAVIKEGPIEDSLREDEVEITFSWVGTDDIERNIQAWFIEDGLLILIHAWRDFTSPDGATRYFNTRNIGRIEIPPDVGRLHDVLGIAYTAVNLWSMRDLQPLPIPR